MTTTPQRPPATVGDYTLLAKIGEGGMGVVHLARRPGGERVALKVLRPHIVGDEEARSRLAREVASLQLIRSRWVAEIVDADPWAPVPYVATRYVPGLSLHDHVVEEGPITGPDLLWFASCLAEGVASVHRAGVLHRDVKPSNVLMEGRTPILIDFGLARVADDPRLTHTGWLLGTPGYLAPEILYGDDATTASDVHSWAATVSYAATGRPPFGRGPSMAIMDRVRRGEHDLTGIPVGLRDLLTRALDPEPARRPRLGEVHDRLRAITEGRDDVGVDAAVDHRVTDRLPVQPRPEPRTPTGLVPETLPVGMVAGRAAHRPTRVLGDHAGATAVAPPDPWWVDEPPTPPVGFGEKTRRVVLLLAAAAVVGLATAAAPWWVLTLVVVVVWLLRSGSLAASAAGDRRRLRGHRWYDGPHLLLRAPWDLVRSLPATVLLVLWSAGLAASAALICYAAATSVDIALGVTGASFAVALWTGPGGSRVRSPLARVVHPLAHRAGPWAVALVVLLVLAAGAALATAQQGTRWSPGSGSSVTDLYDAGR